MQIKKLVTDDAFERRTFPVSCSLAYFTRSQYTLMSPSIVFPGAKIKTEIMINDPRSSRYFSPHTKLEILLATENQT